MKPHPYALREESDALFLDGQEVEQSPEGDLWLSRLVPDFN